MRKIKEVLAAGMTPTVNNNRGRIMMAIFAGLLLQIGIIGYSQTVTMTVKNESLEKVFMEIQKQTGYGFAYKTEILKKGKAVDIDVKQASLENVLAICFKDQPLSYTIVDRVIVISKKEENTGSKIIDKAPDETVKVNGKMHFLVETTVHETSLKDVTVTFLQDWVQRPVMRKIS